MTIKISVRLHDFLRAWHKWAVGGATIKPYCPFRRDVGLCTSLSNWVKKVNTKNLVLDEVAAEDMLDKLSMELFSLLPNRSPYPFGVDEYYRDFRNHKQHLNKNRLAWVKQMIYNSTIKSTEES